MWSKMAMERLYNQQLIGTEFKKIDEIISWLGAIQGQDFPGAKWAVGLRLPGSTDAHVEQTMEDIVILRTWLMRGTLHLVAAEDVRWMLELLAPRIINSNARRYRELGLDEDTLKRSNVVLKEALEKDEKLSRVNLRNTLQENGISTEGQRFAYMLQRASLDGLIVQRGVQRNDPIYMSLDSIPKTKTMERREALAELARRYFQSRGPATIKDFIWWSGLLATDARAALESVKSEFLEENVNGQTYWRCEADVTVQEGSPVAHLLPTFDEYLFGYQDRTAQLRRFNLNKIRPERRYRPTIVINGQIIGLWKRTIKDSGIKMEYHPFIKLNRIENEALNDAELRYSEFLDMQVTSKLFSQG